MCAAFVAQVTCKSTKMDELKKELSEEIMKSWGEHRANGWPDPVPQPHRTEAEVEADYTDDFVVCVLDITVSV